MDLTEIQNYDSMISAHEMRINHLIDLVNGLGKKVHELEKHIEKVERLNSIKTRFLKEEISLLSTTFYKIKELL